jgi:hypothetical protein
MKRKRITGKINFQMAVNGSQFERATNIYVPHGSTLFFQLIPRRTDSKHRMYPATGAVCGTAATNFMASAFSE